MGQAIGVVLPFAVGVAISPMPIVAMVLMLITPRAKANGTAFLLGWVAGVALVGAVALTLMGPAATGSEDTPAAWTYWLKLVLAVVLFALAVRLWRARPAPGAAAPMPKWLDALDGITAVKAGGIAVLLSALNPKNLVFMLGGATALAQLALPPATAAVGWIVFTLIATIGVAAPMAISLVGGDAAASTLQGLKEWMARNNTAVMGVLLVVIGAKLLGDALAGLA